MTQRALAAEIGISEAYLSDFLAGKRNAGKLLLDKLGFEPIAYRRRRQKRSYAQEKVP